MTLNNPDLNSPTGLQNAIAAAKALQRAMNAELKPGTYSLKFRYLIDLSKYLMATICRRT